MTGTRERPYFGKIFVQQQKSKMKGPLKYSNFRSGLKTQPANAKSHYNLANVLKEEGQNTNAIAHYREALRYNQQQIRVFLIL